MAITRAQQVRQMLKEGTKKPVKQAGATNYLGKQEMVTAPKFWLSEPDHVKAKLAYITDEEEQILIDKNLYGSLKGKPNIGPAGLPSLQGGDFGSEDKGSDNQSGGGGGSDGPAGGASAGGDYGGNVRADQTYGGREFQDQSYASQESINRAKARQEQREKEQKEREQKEKEQREREEKKKTIRDRINEYNRNYKKKQLARYQKSKIDELNAKLAGLENFDGFYGDTEETYKDFIENYAPSVTKFGPKGTGKYSQKFIDDVLSGKRPPPESFTPINPDAIPTLAGKGITAFANLVGPKMAGPTTKEELMDLYSGGLDSYIGARDLNVDDYTGREMMEIFEPKRFEREFGDSRDDRDDDLILPTISTPADPATDPVDPRSNFYGLSPRIGGSIFDFTGLADGGRVAAAEGGIMELARQEMFLGGIAKGIKKGLKSATRAIKKVAKSPIGKAALLAAGGSFALGLGPFASGSTMFGGKLAGLTGSGFLKSAGVKNFLFKKGVPGLSNLTGKGIASIIGGASLLPFLMGQKEDDEFDIEAYYAANRLDPNAPLNMRIAGSQFAFAEGGDVEPVAKKTMPLLDMDGQEMDLRAEGGFVPIGRMEKADDVPARLSKNEFVFTADAVRNAGDGDVDKGAEVMYNMMKNLESGGDVSEESQGLSGAREMFQTSKRLEEVL